MSDRDREIERLTEVFKDAILHAPIPDVNPNLIRTVESQARECALRVVGDAPPSADPLVDGWWCRCGTSRRRKPGMLRSEAERALKEHQEKRHGQFENGVL